MDKAVSTIIATILLLVITTALAGSAWIFISASFSSKLGTSFSIIDTFNGTFIIKNDGTGPIIEFTTLTVDDIPVNYFVDTQDSSLIGYWKFDEGAGTAAADSSGLGNNGVLMNETGPCGTLACPSWASGKYVSALDFDGVGDYVDFGDVNRFDGLPAITIAYWVFPREGDDGIMADDSFTMRYSGWASFILNNNTGGNSGYLGQSAGMNQWYYFTGTYDSMAPGNNMKLYVNDTLSAEQHFSGTLSSGGATFRIAIPAGSADRLNGLVDEVRIWNRSLSAEEIKAAFKTGSMVSPGEAATVKIHNSLSTGVHRIRICTASMCQSGQFRIA